MALHGVDVTNFTLNVSSINEINEQLFLSHKNVKCINISADRAQLWCDGLNNWKLFIKTSEFSWYAPLPFNTWHDAVKYMADNRSEYMARYEINSVING